MTRDSITILENSGTEKGQAFTRFLQFLNNLKQVGLLESKSKGLIIVADDQYVNLQALRMSIEDIGKSASKSLRMFSNG